MIPGPVSARVSNLSRKSSNIGLGRPSLCRRESCASARIIPGGRIAPLGEAPVCFKHVARRALQDREARVVLRGKADFDRFAGRQAFVVPRRKLSILVWSASKKSRTISRSGRGPAPRNWRRAVNACILSRRMASAGWARLVDRDGSCRSRRARLAASAPDQLAGSSFGGGVVHQSWPQGCAERNHAHRAPVEH